MGSTSTPPPTGLIWRGKVKRYIVWIDYGCEGWGKFDFDTLDEALTYIQSGVYGRFVLTKRLDLAVEEE